MRKLVLTVLVGLPVLAGCGAATQDKVETPGASTPAPASVYEIDATVLEQAGETSFPKHGPMLCLGAMAMSYPPQCGDVPIRARRSAS